ncbi:hypothetical protein LJR066_001671 [Acidovorax sp. LjRoot66]|uniref:hypothetical protein n=1 Tax=unclassified Acidovorax TaxID=2684926 RepID=UPI0012FA6813|nr:hypothetical protein [Acidovorax sp. Root219]
MLPNSEQFSEFECLARFATPPVQTMFQSEVSLISIETSNVLDCCFGRYPFLDADQTRRDVSNCGLSELGIEAAACSGGWGGLGLELDTASQQGIECKFHSGGRRAVRVSCAARWQQTEAKFPQWIRWLLKQGMGRNGKRPT